ncbi:hypothetical protein [Blautia liquoris]|uniref:hypothetical protein n=1 Tax=Blautia liquoris TaxID=2779518 RepID=UPI002E3549EF|nr:hypothetical protein [Blautia liquoris]
MNTSSRIKTKDMVNIALFTVLIVICSWISIPTVVPFTLQTFAVFFPAWFWEESMEPVLFLFIFFWGLWGYRFSLILPVESVHCWGRREDTLQDSF